MKFNIIISMTEGIRSFGEGIKDFFAENYPDLPSECLAGSKMYTDLVKRIFDDLNHALLERDTLQDLENSLYEELGFEINYQRLIDDIYQQIKRMSVEPNLAIRIVGFVFQDNQQCVLMLEVFQNATV